MQIVEGLKLAFTKKPLPSILFLAILFRILAAVFSQGYGMHDDHFLVIEAPFSWTEGKDYANWMPWSQGENKVVSGHSLFYPGINYFLFKAFKILGITDPKSMMLLMRLLLGLFSVLTVLFGYKIVDKIGGQKAAITAGLMLALLWFMPFFSVRNLVEMITVPFFAAGFWIILQSEGKTKWFWPFLLAGLITGLGISVRFQSAILVAGIGLALLIKKQYFQAFTYGFGALFAFVILQGGIDYFIWGKPFTEFAEYFRYNVASKAAYGTDNVWMYLELILGLLIPPVSVFLFIGFFKVWRKQLIIFLPVFLFLAFHTFFSNRQERFILPVLPFIPILGIVGWYEIVEKSEFWKKRAKFIYGSFVFFWVVNGILLIPVSLSSTKKSRVDVMHYFYKTHEKINAILIEDTGRKRGVMLPVFYTGKTINTVTMTEDLTNPNDSTSVVINPYNYLLFSNTMKYFDSALGGVGQPQYIVFVEDVDLKTRIEHMKKYFPALQHEYDIPPSMLDKIMKKLNPANKNETFYIYNTGI